MFSSKIVTNNREQILLEVTQKYKAKLQLVSSGDRGSIS